jgi:hypothetical protein
MAEAAGYELYSVPRVSSPAAVQGLKVLSYPGVDELITNVLGRKKEFVSFAVAGDEVFVLFRARSSPGDNFK